MVKLLNFFLPSTSFLILAMCFANTSKAENKLLGNYFINLKINEDVENFNLTNHAGYFTPTSEVSPREITSGKFDDQFIKIPTNKPRLKRGDFGTWFVINLNNPYPDKRTYYFGPFLIPYEISIYTDRSDGQILHHIPSNSKYFQRPAYYPYPFGKAELHPGMNKIYFLQKSKRSNLFLASLYDAKHFHIFSSNEYITGGFIVSWYLLILILVVLLGLATKRQEFFWLALYIGTLMYYSVAGRQIGTFNFSEYLYNLSNVSLYISLSEVLSALALNRFSYRYLSIRNHKFLKIAFNTIFLGLAVIAFFILIDKRSFFWIANGVLINITVLCVSGIYLAIKFKQGVFTAFSIAWIPIVAEKLATGLFHMNLLYLPSSVLSNMPWVLPLSTLFLLMIAAAYKIALEEKNLNKKLAESAETIKMQMESLEELNNSLEKRVMNRTKIITEKTRDIRSILSNIHLGIFTFNQNLKVDPEYSKFLEQIFNSEKIEGEEVIHFLLNSTDVSEEKESTYKNAIELVSESYLSYQINDHLLPRQLKINSKGSDKILTLNWNTILDNEDELEKIIVIVRDDTEIHSIQASLESHKEETDIMIEILTSGIQQFNIFNKNSLVYLNICKEHNKADSCSMLFRNAHTIKGNSKTLKYSSIVDTVHSIENYYSSVQKGERAFDEHTSNEMLQEIENILNKYQNTCEKFLGDFTQNGLTNDIETIDLLIKDHFDANHQEKYQMIKDELKQMQQNSLILIRSILAPLLKSVPNLCRDLSKKEASVIVKGDDNKVPEDMANLINDIINHLLKNSIDHGIEDETTRLNKNKSAAGQIYMDFKIENFTLIMTIEDDGRGLNLNLLEKKGLEKGSLTPGSSDQRIAESIFESGLSTASAVSQISGRGIGMDAVKSFIMDQSGSIQIQFLDDKNEEGCRPMRFIINLPLAA